MEQAAAVDYPYEHASSNSSHDYLGPAIARELRAIGPIRRLLDSGCGNGSLTKRYLSLAEKVYALDASESGVAHAQKVIGKDQVCLASAYDDLTCLFPGVTQFDAIVSAEVIEHLYNPRAFLKRAAEALVPGGSLVLSTPYHGYLKNLALAVAGAMDTHYTALWDGGHIKFWSRRTLNQVLNEAGFEEVAFAGAGRAPFLWKSMIIRARLRK